MATFESDDKAAAKALDEKKRIQEPMIPRKSLRERVTSALSSVTCSLKRLKCLGSPHWSAPLLIASPLLVTTWYIYVLYFVDTDAMASKYAFDVPSHLGFIVWGYMMEIAVPFIVLRSTLVSFGETERVVRRCLYFASVIYVILLIVGNALGAGQVEKRLALAPEFAVQFNSYYCDSRTLRMCLEGSQDDLLLLIRGNETTVVGTKTNMTIDEQAAAVWSQCQKVIVATMARAHLSEDDSSSDKKLELGQIYKFVTDCGHSSEMDAWCGNLLRQTSSPLPDTEQRSIPSPFAVNAAMFDRYTHEWSRRLLLSNILLGTAAGCLVFGAWSFKINEAATRNG